MSKTVTLGGDRLGSGKKEKVHLHNYERSSHDLGYIWRSTMASGTLVPFMSLVGLPGDSFDIDLDIDVKTHPTIGPLFGSFKIQMDVFQVPIRLYQGQLHMNKLGIGLDMSKIHLPQIRLQAGSLNPQKQIDIQHINPSCIFSYLGIKGLASGIGNGTDVSKVYNRAFNAIPYLAYWDIYKNYYSNKQEEIGAVIHNNLEIIGNYNTPTSIEFRNIYSDNQSTVLVIPHDDYTLEIAGVIGFSNTTNSKLVLSFSSQLAMNDARLDKMYVRGDISYATSGNWDINTFNKPISEIFKNIDYDEDNLEIILSENIFDKYVTWRIYSWNYKNEFDAEDEVEPKVHTFDLKNIDTMRENILMAVQQGTPFRVDQQFLEPYSLPLKAKLYDEDRKALFSKLSTMEGLALKTYQSDIFNNWISTEWIDGDNGINEITKIDTSDGNFTIDEFILSRKIYDMLNRIAVSGGTYDDWLDATYTHERTRGVESPVYMGGLIKELAFQEVVSNSEYNNEPLGTLAGRGVLTNKHKGGKVKIRIDEPSYIIGIVSLTPRIDYSQGNSWDVNLKTMNDFHKPALDQIGFQDLITDQIAWWDTRVTAGADTVFNSAGKQPAWINYMTNFNKVYGNFAIENNQMFMVLNRRYEYNLIKKPGEAPDIELKDLTTYIDPVKFNHIFAYTKRDAQNFWTQIKVDINARRKMSAKVMPNL